jgi:CRP-like cAMP-binding protein
VDKRKTLAKTELFKTLSSEGLELAAAKCAAVSFKEGDAVLVEGRAADAVYVLTAGEVNYIKRMDDKSGLILFRWKPGDCFGLNSVLDGQEQFVSAVAATPAQALKIAAADFWALCAADAAFEHRILTQALLVQSGRLRQLTTRLREFLGKILK